MAIVLILPSSVAPPPLVADGLATDDVDVKG